MRPHQAIVSAVCVSLSVLVAAACHSDTPPSAPTGATPSASSATPDAVAAASATAVSDKESSLCAAIGTLIEAAQKDFPDLRRLDKPVTVDGSPGFESKTSLEDTVECRILTSEKPYPDAFECDLAKPESRDKAFEVVKRWAPIVGACPQTKGWKAEPPTAIGYTWHKEVPGNHELAIHLSVAGDAQARPTIQIRMNEI